MNLAGAIDTLNRHEGFEWSLGFERRFQWKRLSIGPSIEMKNESRHLADYYFGVEQEEALPMRPAYQAGQITNWVVGINARYPATDRQTLFVSVNREFLDSEIRRSPIVERKFLTRFIAAWSISF